MGRGVKGWNRNGTWSDIYICMVEWEWDKEICIGLNM